jgi:hypothetical protein
MGLVPVLETGGTGMPNASRLRRETPSGMLSARYAFALGVRFALTPVAYGGKPSCSTGLTSCSAGSPTQDWRIYLLEIFYWLNRLEILHITLKI